MLATSNHDVPRVASRWAAAEAATDGERGRLIKVGPRGAERCAGARIGCVCVSLCLLVAAVTRHRAAPPSYVPIVVCARHRICPSSL